MHTIYLYRRDKISEYTSEYPSGIYSSSMAVRIRTNYIGYGIVSYIDPHDLNVIVFTKFTQTGISDYFIVIERDRVSLCYLTADITMKIKLTKFDEDEADRIIRMTECAIDPDINKSLNNKNKVNLLFDILEKRFEPIIDRITNSASETKPISNIKATSMRSELI